MMSLWLYYMVMYDTSALWLCGHRTHIVTYSDVIQIQTTDLKWRVTCSVYGVCLATMNRVRQCAAECGGYINLGSGSAAASWVTRRSLLSRWHIATCSVCSGCLATMNCVVCATGVGGYNT